MIVYLDVVGWEPVVFRFIPSTKTNEHRQKELADFLRSFFNDRAAQEKSNLKYWDIRPGNKGDVVVSCEFFGEADIASLGETVSKQFPSYVKVEVGERAKAVGMPEGNDIRWVTVRQSSVRDAPSAFQVSKHHITIGQYFTFLDQSGYAPYVDRKGIWSFRRNQICEGGRAWHKWPVTQVTLHDAAEYCKWLGGWLPSESELITFFHVLFESKPRIAFTNEMWTSTTTSDQKVVVINNPTSIEELKNRKKLRSFYSADHYDFPFISFRACRAYLHTPKRGRTTR